jgi:hypothetical protein
MKASLIHSNIIDIVDDLGYPIIGIIRHALYQCWWVCQNKKDSNIELEVHNWINAHLADCNLSRSFNQKMVLIYDETLHHEILILLHKWFQTKSCNLKNIFLITTHTSGAKIWYENYAKLVGETPFNLVEATWLSREFVNRFNVPPVNETNLRKNLKFYFSYYGGSRSSYEKDFVVSLILSKSNLGYIDYLAGFHKNITSAGFKNYAEKTTNFLNENLVEQLTCIRETHKFNNDMTDNLEPERDEKFDRKGFQYKFDMISGCQIVRETLNSTGFSIMTEKIIRPFLHLQLPMPLAVNAIDNLNNLGFNLDFDLIDYSYQHEPVLFYRLTKLLEQIEKLSAYKLSYLEEYILDNKEKFLYNYEYIRSNTVFDNIKQQVIKELTQ